MLHLYVSHVTSIHIYFTGVLQTGQSVYREDGHNMSNDAVILQLRHMAVSDATDAVSLHRTRESVAVILISLLTDEDLFYLFIY